MLWFHRYFLPLWKMGFSSIAASEMTVFLGLCKGVEWASAFVLKTFVRPCGKERLSFKLQDDVSIFAGKPFCIS